MSEDGETRAGAVSFVAVGVLIIALTAMTLFQPSPVTTPLHASTLEMAAAAAGASAP